jgi:hypothetical protein
MRNNLKVICVLGVFVACCLSAWGQIDPTTQLSVQPLPLPGGNIFPGCGLYHQFFPGPPGQTPPFDPINADPHGITNFRGIPAMGYTLGSATDNQGNPYGVITDIRVYKGEYLGGKAADLKNTAGYTESELASGIFVEI